MESTRGRKERLQFEEVNRFLLTKRIRSYLVLRQVNIGVTKEMITLSRKRKKLDGDNLISKGKSVKLGETIEVIPNKSGSMKEAILIGKCHAVSYLDASGTDKFGNYLYYEGYGDPYDLLLEAIDSPKWMPVNVNWAKAKLAATARDFFGTFEPYDPVRVIVREHIPNRYLEDYDGAYVNTNGSYAGMFKLRDKMRGKVMNGKIQVDHGVDPSTIRAIQMIFLERCELHKSNIPVVIDQLSVSHNSFRSSAALGGNPYDFDNCGTKGNWLDIHKKNMEWIIQQLLDGAMPEDILAPWYHVMAAKAEVRAKDVPVDKVRIIFQQFMEADAVGEYMSKPITEWFRHLDWYLPGTSMMGNHYPKLLRSLKHPHARRYWEDFSPSVVPLMYIYLDQTAQDWNYLSETLAFLMFIRFLFYQPGSGESHDFFVKLFGWELSWVFCKLIQLWGGTWWILFGAFCSGSKWTTWTDTCQSFLIFLTVLHSISGDLNYSRDVIHLGISCYGDDTSVSLPYDPDRWDYPNLLDDIVSAGSRIGCVYKKGGSGILLPTANHKDRFYTHIYRTSPTDGSVCQEYVISEGLKMLQRQFVKVDKALNILHPDAEDFFTALPWRPTVDYVVKLGLDPNNWKDTTGAWVQWYRKAFGLLLDSAANREAHEIIKSAMAHIREIYSEQVSIACSGFEWKDSELALKLGDIDPNLIYKLPAMNNSYRIVCSMYVPKPHKIVDLKPAVRNYSLPAVYATRP